MVSMADKRTWLDGPNIPGEYDDAGTPGRWPGEHLGLPESGPGSMASVGRRAGAVAIDWIICMLLANLILMFTTQLGGVSFLGYALWALMGIICGWLFARTPGMLIRGMGVALLDVPCAQVGFWRAAVRTLLTGVIFPAAMVDADGRGMHDRATGTIVINS